MGFHLPEVRVRVRVRVTLTLTLTLTLLTLTLTKDSYLDPEITAMRPDRVLMTLTPNGGGLPMRAGHALVDVLVRGAKTWLLQAPSEATHSRMHPADATASAPWPYDAETLFSCEQVRVRPEVRLRLRVTLTLTLSLSLSLSLSLTLALALALGLALALALALAQTLTLALTLAATRASRRPATSSSCPTCGRMRA
jgi:serine/threonine-protein kinase ATR